jgi:hypothetical protein
MILHTGSKTMLQLIKLSLPCCKKVTRVRVLWNKEDFGVICAINVVKLVALRISSAYVSIKLLLTS